MHEANIPGSVAAREMRLRVLEWPVFYTVTPSHLASLSSEGPQLRSSGTYQNAVVIGDVQIQDATVAAKYLATHIAHHLALGFDLYMLYVRGTDLADALEANAVTAEFLHEQKLQIISLDSLQIPWYDDGSTYQDMLAHFHQRKVAAYDSVKLVAYNHAALTLWGQRYRLAVLDLDEMWSSKLEAPAVNSWFESCFAEFDVVKASRVNMVCRKCFDENLPELQFFQQTWDASNPTEVLRHFSTVAGYNKDTKSVFDVDKVGQVWLHKPFVPSHNRATELPMYNKDTDLSQECAFVVHLPNIFGQRSTNLSSASLKPHWLVHGHRQLA